ncbi:hypothetical protein SDC9_124495 [bioreactor metagenome]|uniref:Nif11 domain-containing protein n=1 Tax=bioreactor metagenome TaxID=1076179 RepID=A0A645CL58_9ZZZZ|nr:Nif11-like leader peptide family RiPP precursor [Oscillospiraceae bacterium]
MSLKNAKIFLEELSSNETMQKQLNKMNPKLPEDVVSFAKDAHLSFTKEEMRGVLAEMGALKLTDEELEKISAGAFPTAINSQITDSVTQVNSKILGDAPAIAMGNLYVATSQALSNAAQNAIINQQQNNATMQASTTMGIATIFTLNTLES